MTPDAEKPAVMMLVGAGQAEVARAWAHAFHGRGIRVSHVFLEHRSKGAKFRLLWRRLLRHGPFRVGGQLLYRAFRKGASEEGARRNPDIPPPAYGWEEVIEAHSGWPSGTVVSDLAGLADPGALEALARAAAGAKAAVVYGTSILPKPVIEALPALTLNLHTGLTQHYRGVNSTFWALADGEPGRIGVTIHRVSAGIDTGRILAQKTLGPDIAYTWRSMAWLDRAVAAEGERLMVDVVEGALLKGADTTGSKHPKGKLTTDPTWCEYRRVLRHFKLR